MVKTGVDTIDMLNYYKTTKGGNLEDYATEDFYTILSMRLYTDLPINVTKVAFKCLSVYKYLSEVVNRKGRAVPLRWSANLSTGKVGIIRTYEYIIEPELPIKKLDQEEYALFISHYIKANLQDYYTNDGKWEDGGNRAKPLIWFNMEMRMLIRVINSYRKKNGKSTTTILEIRPS